MTREMLSDFRFVAACSFISVSETAADDSSQHEQQAPIFYEIKKMRENVLSQLRNKRLKTTNDERNNNATPIRVRAAEIADRLCSRLERMKKIFQYPEYCTGARFNCI